MAAPRHESSLSARQRLALTLILMSAMASFCIMLWKSRRQSAPATRTEQVAITEFQTIPPVYATVQDTARKQTPQHPDGRNGKDHKTRSGDKKRRKVKQTAKPAPPPRDITSETVSPR